MDNAISREKMALQSHFFYLLRRKNEIIHLTFDPKRHQKAAALLQKAGFVITVEQQKTMTLKKLQELLMQQRSFKEFRHLPFISEATAFQQKVWQLLVRIPFGQTQTYGEVAEKLGNRAQARAVGQACNANPLALLIPCHRVVGQSGLGGFAGGGAIKATLLQLEKKG